MEKDKVAELIYHIGMFKDVKDFTGSILKKNGLDFGFYFLDEIAGKYTEVIVGFNNNFPLSIPQYFIKENEKFDFIPHIERDGKVCYIHEDYVYLNADDPYGIITETYNLTKATIERGLNKSNFIDFINEFEAYWNRIDGCETIFGNLIIPNEPKLIKIGYNEDKRFAVSEAEGCINQIHRFIKLNNKGVTYKNGIIIPFIVGSEFMPPRYNEPVSIDYLKSIIDSLNKKEKQKLFKLCSRLKCSELYVLFSFKHDNGNHSLFGVKFSSAMTICFALTAEEFKGKITPINVHRLDKEYLFKRGGLGLSSFEKKGLIIGGGSIGGFISEELVRNGFFDLTIVDGDILSSDNCYRHLTGYSFIGKSKALAIKEKVERYFPHSKITEVSDSIENALAKKKINFNNFDFIIIATGNVTINIYLNNLLNKNHLGTPVFYAWNDPYGIGGHCLVTNIKKGGCYSCIYTNENFYNTASFAHQNQPKSFLKSISGCGSLYTPYGSMDSMQTCLITIKKVIDVMNDSTENNAIYSWKGKSTIFLAEGYNLSERYNMTESLLAERRHAFENKQCKTCQV